jgi:hypothetical protein
MDRVLVQSDQTPLQHRNAQSGRSNNSTPHQITALIPHLGCPVIGEVQKCRAEHPIHLWGGGLVGWACPAKARPARAGSAKPQARGADPRAARGDDQRDAWLAGHPVPPSGCVTAGGPRTPVTHPLLTHNVARATAPDVDVEHPGRTLRRCLVMDARCRRQRAIIVDRGGQQRFYLACDAACRAASSQPAGPRLQSDTASRLTLIRQDFFVLTRFSLL